MKIPAFVFLVVTALSVNAKNDSTAVINNAEDYYAAISLDSTLQRKEKAYDNSEAGITEGKLVAFYKKGKLVLLVNSYTDGPHCYEDVAFAIKNNLPVFREVFRQCTFEAEEGPVETYTDERDYFKKGKLLYVQSGIGPDEEGDVKFYTASVEDGSEQKMLADLAFWKAFLETSLSFADFSKGWHFTF